MKALTRLFPFVYGHLVAVCNLFMVATWWLGGLALVALVRIMKLPVGYSVIAGLAIILLNPQAPRMGLGHHGLFHPLLPAVFLLWYKIYASAGYRTRSLLLGAVLSTMLFLHQYQFGLGALAACLCTICAEAILFTVHLPLYPAHLPDISDPNDRSYGSLDPRGFQAVFTNPYFNIGIENIRQDKNVEMMRHSFGVSLSPGLPNSGASLSRSGLRQAMINYGMSVLPYTEAPFLSHLPSLKPFLVVESKAPVRNKLYQLDWRTDDLPVLFENDAIRLKSLSPERYREVAGMLRDSLMRDYERSLQAQKSGPAPVVHENGAWLDSPAANKQILCNSVYSAHAPRGFKNMVIPVWYRTKNLESNVRIDQFDKYGRAIISYIENGGKWLRQINERTTPAEIPLVPETPTTALRVALLNEEFGIPLELQRVWLYDDRQKKLPGKGRAEILY